MIEISGILKLYHRTAGLSLLEYDSWLELHRHGCLVEILRWKVSQDRILEIADSYVTK